MSAHAAAPSASSAPSGRWSRARRWSRTEGFSPRYDLDRWTGADHQARPQARRHQHQGQDLLLPHRQGRHRRGLGVLRHQGEGHRAQGLRLRRDQPGDGAGRGVRRHPDHRGLVAGPARGAADRRLGARRSGAEDDRGAAKPMICTMRLCACSPWRVFACTFGGALAGMRLRRRCPSHHLSSEARDTIKVGIGLVATMTALVLGLLDGVGEGYVRQPGRDGQAFRGRVAVARPDLARYGAETAKIRERPQEHGRAADRAASGGQ